MSLVLASIKTKEAATRGGILTLSM